jgi:hypothetical protein
MTHNFFYEGTEKALYMAMSDMTQTWEMAWEKPNLQ